MTSYYFNDVKVKEVEFFLWLRAHYYYYLREKMKVNWFERKNKKEKGNGVKSQMFNAKDRQNFCKFLLPIEATNTHTSMKKNTLILP